MGLGKRRNNHAYIMTVVAIVGLSSVAASEAAAVTTSQWADWQELSGTGGNYSTSVEIASFPLIEAQMQSDSRSGSVGIISGQSTWLSADTPVGQKYGSSKDQPYINLRPRADNAESPSTTVYSFGTPTPTSNWTFVVGDIDADKLQIQAVGPDGVPLTADEIGYMGGFNYCAPGLTGKPSCSGETTDIPSWDPSSMTLTGNALAQDTNGSSAWFEPSAPISSLTFIYTRREGFPIYQTWFASLSRDISGTVTTQSGDGNGILLSLLDSQGNIIASTTTTDGTYSFAGVQATDGYTVSLTAPIGMIVDGAVNKPADLSTSDAVVDFSVRDIVPVAVSGTVTDTNNEPIIGATVTIPGVGSVLTGADGSYLFDQVPVGTHQPELTLPVGYTLVVGASEFTIPVGSEDPITDENFVVASLPSLSGTVTTSGNGTPGIKVTASGNGNSFNAITNNNGGYIFPGLTAGEYTVTVTVPEGSTAVGPTNQTVTIAGNDVPNIDFALAKEGSVTGIVTSPNGPIKDVTLTLDGPGGEQTVLSDNNGHYYFGKLTAGTYTVTVNSPEGYQVKGSSTHSFVISDSGETIVDQDFELLAATIPPTASPSITTSNTATPTITSSANPSNTTNRTSASRLAKTGLQGPLVFLSVMGLLGLGASAFGAKFQRK